MAKDDEKAVFEKLHSVPLFSGLDDKQLRSVAKSGTVREFSEGKAIVSEGEMGVGFFLILDGKVEVRRKSKVLAKLGAGDFFGEMSLIDDSPRSSDVFATAPTKCLVLSAWSFQGLVSSNKDLALKLLKTVVKRLRENNKALSD